MKFIFNASQTENTTTLPLCIMGAQSRAPLKPLQHPATMVMRGLRRAINRVIILPRGVKLQPGMKGSIWKN